VGGATFVSLLGNHLLIHLTVINYKIFGKVDRMLKARPSKRYLILKTTKLSFYEKSYYLQISERFPTQLCKKNCRR